MVRELNGSNTEQLVWPLSREDRVAVLAARQTLTPSERDEIARLLAAGSLDWNEVVLRARWHRLSGLLFQHLQSPELIDLVGESTIQPLKDDYLRATVSHMYGRRELLRITDALRERGIPVVLLKGIALVETVYSSSGVRPMGDLDLLVPMAQAEQAQVIVEALGYRPGGTVEDQRDTRENHRHLPALVGVGKPVVAEIHRHIIRLDSPLRFDIRGFWDRVEPLSLDGRDHVYTLAPDDAVFHLAINFFLDRRFHSMAALGQLCDLREVTLARQEDLPWDRLVGNVRGSRLAGPTACVLELARDLLDACIPEDVIRDLYPEGIDRDRLNAFAAQRVIAPRSWIARELVASDRRYDGPSMFRGMLRRLVPSRRYMASRYGVQARGWSGLQAYLTRWGEGVFYAWDAMRNPSAFRNDVATDRWLHSLTEQPRAKGGQSSDSRNQNHHV